jgi:hypothetical protein
MSEQLDLFSRPEPEKNAADNTQPERVDVEQHVPCPLCKYEWTRESISLRGQRYCLRCGEYFTA